MEKNYNYLIKSINHLKILHRTFSKKSNYGSKEDYMLYKENSKKLKSLLDMPEVELHKQLYSQKSRQMILADIIEYIFISRGIFFMSEKAGNKEKKKRKRELFIEIILNFVNTS